MILITGAFGFIGSHAARALLDAGQSVVAARNRNAEIPSFLAPELGDRLFVESVDVRSAEAVRRVTEEYDVSSVLHLAAPPLGRLNAVEEFHLNMQGLINVVEAANARRMQRVSIASSVAVYGGLSTGPFFEDQPLRPSSSNATEAYKKAYEVLGQHLGGQLGLDVVCMRIGHIYGPGYRSLANLPSRIVHAAAKGLPGPLPRQGAPEPFAQDGGDFCYVKDCAHGLRLLHLAERLPHRIYNVGSGRMSTYGEFAAGVQALRPDALVNLSAGQGPQHVRQSVMDISRARTDVGYNPQFGPTEAVADYLGWLAAGHPL